jgi:acetyltransferase-like isoleucine patch superfamily enzyme
VIDPAARVHATAELDADVSIGADAAVWDRAVVRRGGRIGAGSSVGRDVLIDEEVSVGTGVVIHTGALLYRGVSVEDGVSIGPRAILTNDRYPRTDGADPGVPVPGDTGEIRIEHGASIGAGAVIVASSVGRFATVGAGAVVTHTVPPHALVAGNPAHRIGWVCACGNRLSAASGEPAPAEVERYASDPFLNCNQCERRYVYVPDHDSLEERRGPAVPAGARA